MKPDETQVSASNVMKDTCEKEKIAASALNKGHTTKTVEKTCSDEAAPTIQIGIFEKIAFMFVACLVPLAIILPLVLTRKAPFHAASTVTPTKPPTATQTQAPTVTPTDPPTETRLSMFSTIIGSMFYDQLFPSSLAQGLALAWLAQEDPAYLPVDSEPETLLERFTLVLLYFATRGDNWPYRAGWLSNQHFCDWEGVICNESQHVSELDFCKFLVVL